MKCEEFIFDLQNEQKNLNQRKRELNEFRKFVDLYINPKYKEKLVLFIERIAEQIAAQERKEYDLERKKFPEHIRKSEHYEKILRYLANFIPPEPFEPQEPNFSHLKIYEYEGCPTKDEFTR